MVPLTEERKGTRRSQLLVLQGHFQGTCSGLTLCDNRLMQPPPEKLSHHSRLLLPDLILSTDKASYRHRHQETNKAKNTHSPHLMLSSKFTTHETRNSIRMWATRRLKDGSYLRHQESNVSVTRRLRCLSCWARPLLKGTAKLDELKHAYPDILGIRSDK